MDVKTLQQHLIALATLNETDAPVVSCYLNLERGPMAYRSALDARVELLRRSLPEPRRSQVAAAMEPIEAWLRDRPANGWQGLALFSRAGDQPFFLPLAFRVPLPTWISVDLTPNIYHLVEIKDNYDRYVVLFATEESARILGINLGDITQDIWKNRPDLRHRVGNEWTKEHFQDHRRERGKQFVREQIRIADQLMSAGGYGHLIVAGSARITAEIRQALPKHLKAKLVDVVSASANDRISDVVDGHSAILPRSRGDRVAGSGGATLETDPPARSCRGWYGRRHGGASRGAGRYSGAGQGLPIQLRHGYARPAVPSHPKRRVPAPARGALTSPCGNSTSRKRWSAWRSRRAASWKWWSTATP